MSDMRLEHSPPESRERRKICETCRERDRRRFGAPSDGLAQEVRRARLRSFTCRQHAAGTASGVDALVRARGRVSVDEHPAWLVRLVRRAAVHGIRTEEENVAGAAVTATARDASTRTEPPSFTSRPDPSSATASASRNSRAPFSSVMSSTRRIVLHERSRPVTSRHVSPPLSRCWMSWCQSNATPSFGIL